MPINDASQNKYGAGRKPPAQSQPPRGPGRPPISPRQNAAPPRPGRPPRQNPRENEEPQGRFKRIGSNWFMAIVMVLITLVSCFFLAMFILQSASDLFGLNQPDNEVEISVPNNASVSSIAAMLYDKGVISQPFTFSMYASIKTKEGDILGGDYVFNSNDAYDQIILMLKNGNTKKEEVTVTFIEGWTLYEIAVKLEENRVCGADEFIEYLNTEKLDYEFMKQVPSSPLRFNKLEGYVFPDTYDFDVGMEPAYVADKFFKNLSKRITDDMYEKMKELNLTLDQTLILASIIQKEADTNIENKTVSQVFHNRLLLPENFPQLQSDVTIHYVEQFIKPFLDRENQPMYDAYNTYVREGLPIGAICNPGLDAINAALEPDGTGFYYFVTDDVGTYYYATNLQQHLYNVSRASQVGGENVHGTNTIGGN